MATNTFPTYNKNLCLLLQVYDEVRERIAQPEPAIPDDPDTPSAAAAAKRPRVDDAYAQWVAPSTASRPGNDEVTKYLENAPPVLVEDALDFWKSQVCREINQDKLRF